MAVTTAPVVLLNASWEVLGLVSTPRAIGFLVTKRAESVASDDVEIRSAVVAFEAPLVVRLTEYVKVPRRALELPWSRRGVRRRDGNTCAYCGGPGSTVDHIVPRSRGGRDEWLNTVTACSDCNGRKGNRTPEQAGMRMLFQPTIPTRTGVLLHRMSDRQREALAGFSVRGAEETDTYVGQRYGHLASGSAA